MIQFKYQCIHYYLKISRCHLHFTLNEILMSHLVEQLDCYLHSIPPRLTLFKSYLIGAHLSIQ